VDSKYSLKILIISGIWDFSIVSGKSFSTSALDYLRSLLIIFVFLILFTFSFLFSFFDSLFNFRDKIGKFKLIKNNKKNTWILNNLKIIFFICSLNFKYEEPKQRSDQLIHLLTALFPNSFKFSDKKSSSSLMDCTL
jgi:hypothetical protein